MNTCVQTRYSHYGVPTVFGAVVTTHYALENQFTLDVDTAHVGSDEEEMHNNYVM